MQTIAIILVVVIVLSVGFAVFSSTLNISAQAQINPNSVTSIDSYAFFENLISSLNIGSGL